MAKVSVTYNAPEDDSEVVTMGGVRFFDGQAVELDDEKEQHFDLLKKLRTNQHFKVNDGETFVSPAPVDEGNKTGFGGASQNWN